jgi:hypothetical protein
LALGQEEGTYEFTVIILHLRSPEKLGADFPPSLSSKTIPKFWKKNLAAKEKFRWCDQVFWNGTIVYPTKLT